MSDTNPRDELGISRRRLLQVSGGTAALLGLGTGQVSADESASDSDDSEKRDDEECPEATLEPAMVHYDDSIHEVCSDTHPETERLQADVRTTFEEKYPTVGSLMDAGFIPYFDFFNEGSWSHWLSPAFLSDDSTLDADRPESVLVDHSFWRPIGVMFIATDEGENVDPPPTIYVEDSEGDDGGGACIPWHAHVGLPSRYSWWKYRQVFEDGGEFPCRTPWMAHVWRYSHPESLYAHSAPEERGGPPAEDPGFDTDADPEKEEFGPKHLPDAIWNKIEGLW